MRGFELILVNNGSTDASELVCRRSVHPVTDVRVQFLNEYRPGQVYALEAGINQVDTDYVAICDANTYYPPHYLSLADSIFKHSNGNAAAVMAMDIYTHPHGTVARLARLKGLAISRVLRKQCHTGGYGMCFNTDILKRAGGAIREGPGRTW